MRTRLLVLCVVAVFGAAGPLDAQVEPDLFSRLDANKDGFVSSDEVPDEHKSLFDRLLRIAGKEDEKKLNKALFQAALKSDEAQRPARQPGDRGRRGAPPPERPGRDLRELEALFDRTDANSDGKLTKDEVPEQRPMIRRIFERIGSDSITKEQFVRAMRALAQEQPRPADGRPDAPPGGLFAILDTDRDGRLSTAEIVAAGTVLLRHDRNGDGQLTPDELFRGPPRP